MSSTEPGAYDVPYPFNEDGAGDCILQSVDGARFKVFRYGLLLASPFFKGMFELPQPCSSESGAEVPLLDVSEDAPTIHALLLILYPVGAYQLPDYEVATAVAKAFDKYEIPLGRMAPFARHLYNDQSELETHALGLYALAWRLGMEPEAKVAARYTHEVDLTTQATKELVSRSGGAHCPLALMQMRLKREAALDDIIKALKLSIMFCTQRSSYSDCYHYVKSTEDNYFRKIMDVKAHARQSLQSPYPALQDVKSFFGITQGSGMDGAVELNTFCSSCPGYRDGAFEGVTRAVAQAIQDYPQTIDM